MLEKIILIYEANKKKTHILIFLIGINLLIFPNQFDANVKLIQVLSALGAAFITASLIFLVIGDTHDVIMKEHRKLFMDLYSKSSITNDANNVGLIKIINKRSSIDFSEIFNKEGIKEIDICGVTLKTPLYSQITSGCLSKLIDSGTKIRVLLSHPESTFIRERMVSENNHSLKANNESVVNRLIDLMKHPKNNFGGYLDLNFFDGFKDSFYLRVNNLIYTYSYSYAQDASNEPVYIYRHETEVGSYLSEIFEKKWSDRSHLFGKYKIQLFELRKWLYKNYRVEYQNFIDVLSYSERFSLELNNNLAGPALCYSALMHDVERGFEDRVKKPKLQLNSGSYDEEYNKYKIDHQNNSMLKFIEICKPLKIDHEIIEEASILIKNHDVPESNYINSDLEILRAADGFVFFKNDLEKYKNNNGKGRLKKKVKFMWRFSEELIERYPNLKEVRKQFNI